jgi:hypothetical protein
MVPHFVLKALAGSLRKHVFSGADLQMGGRATPRPYKPWRLWRAFAWGIVLAILFQASHWAEIYHEFETSSLVTSASDVIGRIDVIPIIFVLVAAARNAVMKRRRSSAQHTSQNRLPRR